MSAQIYGAIWRQWIDKISLLSSDIVSSFGSYLDVLLQLSYLVNPFNTLRPRQNGRHFADDILKCIFLNENVWIPIETSLNFVPKGPIDDIPALV